MNSWDQYIKTLQGIICPKCSENIAHGQNELVIKETDRSATLKKITLTNLSSQFAAFFPEKAKPKICAMLSSTGDYQKAADALIFLCHNGINYILICELKSGTTSRLSAQLKNTASIADFITALSKHHHGLTLPAWQMRFIVLTKRGRLRKRPTRQKKSMPQGQTADRPLEIVVHNNESIHVARLCC